MQASFSYPRARFPWFFFLLVTIAALIFAAVATQQVDFSVSHGVQKHGYSALQIRECLNKNSTLQVWVNPTTGRRANVCQLDPATFGIQIIQNSGGVWKEITAFTKDKLHRIDQVMQYLTNTGYHIIH